MSDEDWITFFETTIPRWWIESPGLDLKPLKEWFLWTQSRDVSVDDPQSLAYPTGKLNALFFRMVLDRMGTRSRSTGDPFIRVYRRVEELADLTEIRKKLCSVQELTTLARAGGGSWRLPQIPSELIANVDVVLAKTRSESFEKYIHLIVAEILGKGSFRFPEPEVGASPQADELAMKIVRRLVSPKFKLRGVADEMAKYQLRHLIQIPGARQLAKIDHQSRKAGMTQQKLERLSQELIDKNRDRIADAELLFSPAVLNMAVYGRGVVAGEH